MCTRGKLSLQHVPASCPATYPLVCTSLQSVCELPAVLKAPGNKFSKFQPWVLTELFNEAQVVRAFNVHRKLCRGKNIPISEMTQRLIYNIKPQASISTKIPKISVTCKRT